MVSSRDLVEVVAMTEFCFGGLEIVCQPEAAKIFEASEQLLTECGWIIAANNVCIVCDRPTKLSLDHESRLHAEGESAIALTISSNY
jgi:internalin A